MNFQNPEDTICALSTPQGMGAIALIRVSGQDALTIVDEIFTKPILNQKPRTAIFGSIVKGQEIIDEVVVTFFKNPASFTGENLIEIACHGSVYIQKEIIQLILSKGARLAGPGEFSLRAFLNGKMDLSQTEAIADLISSGSKAAHKVAMQQMRGGFSRDIELLRQELLNFASLVELELDFSEEDVEFADRKDLLDLVEKVSSKVNRLVESFQLGNVMKNGVPVAIVGPPNAGKSTLLNALLKEDKAIVSDIAGTTRDVIEDTIILEGQEFRLIDTAGIRETSDQIELIGVERAYQQIKKAEIILLLVDISELKEADVIARFDAFKENSVGPNQQLIGVFNKKDKSLISDYKRIEELGVVISAKNQEGLDGLIKALLAAIPKMDANESVVTNIRHFEILKKCKESLVKVNEGLEMQIPGDLLAMDIRETINLLGEITGTITNDELLGNIFANFCIGK